MNLQTKIRFLPQTTEYVSKGVSEDYLYSFQKCRCFYCNKFMDYAKFHKDKRPNGYTVDHVIPAKLGYTRAGNIVLACRKCNHDKADRLPLAIEVRNAMVLYALMGKKFIAYLD